MGKTGDLQKPLVAPSEMKVPLMISHDPGYVEISINDIQTDPYPGSGSSNYASHLPFTDTDAKNSSDTGRIHSSCQFPYANHDCARQTVVDVTEGEVSTHALPVPGSHVIFYVGEGRQMMMGKDCELALVSPVFAALLSERWKGGEDVAEIDISDVDPPAFGVILR